MARAAKTREGKWREEEERGAKETQSWELSLVMELVNHTLGPESYLFYRLLSGDPSTQTAAGFFFTSEPSWRRLRLNPCSTL
jgi:hypothetical protein